MFRRNPHLSNAAAKMAFKMAQNTETSEQVGQIKKYLRGFDHGLAAINVLGWFLYWSSYTRTNNAHVIDSLGVNFINLSTLSTVNVAFSPFVLFSASQAARLAALRLVANTSSGLIGCSAAYNDCK